MDKITPLIQKLSHDIIDVQIRSTNTLLFKLQRGIIDDAVLTSPMCVLDVLNGIERGLEKLCRRVEKQESKDLNSLVVSLSSICNLILSKISQYESAISCTETLASILQKYYSFLNDKNFFPSTQEIIKQVCLNQCLYTSNLASPSISFVSLAFLATQRAANRFLLLTPS